MMVTDEEILRSWERNSQEGFRLLYDRYAGVLLRYIYRFTGNQEQAEEILQDVFTEVLKTDFANFDHNFKAWLFTVSKNKSLNFERRKKREVLSDESVQRAVDPHGMEEQISHAQILCRIEDLQIHLPADLAKTWSLRKQGLDYQEIASELKIPLGTVKSRFSRLVDYFKKEFKLENSD
jgi:RNA polymerase sigma-70 factor (ECF subfamily)